MNIKAIKPLLPPIVIKLALRIKNYLGLYEWKFVSFNWDNKYNTSGDGWDLKSISELQLEKWNNYSEIVNGVGPLGVNHEGSIPYDNQNIIFHNLLMTFSYIAGLATLQKKEINFLDWGGGIGHYGLLIKKILPSTDVNYFCYDLNTFSETSKQLWDDNSVFSSNRGELLQTNKYDLVMAGSSIWYEPDWKTIFKKLIEASNNYVFITRMIFVEKGKSYVAVQRPSSMGYKTKYYFWVINENELLEQAKENGAVLVREFLVFEEKTHIYKAPEQGKFKGFLFRKQK